MSLRTNKEHAININIFIYKRKKVKCLLMFVKNKDHFNI